MSDRRCDLLYGVLTHMRPLTLASARIVEATWRGHGVTVGMRAVLAVLAAAGPRPVPGLAAHLDLTRQAVQRHVNDLVDLGMVVTRPNPVHRRSALVMLTDEGDRLWRDQHGQELTAMTEMATDCSEAELRTALRVLTALGADLDARARDLGGRGA